MSRFHDRLAPILAAGVVVAVAAGVVGLIGVANERGTDALTQAKLAQVKATANSFNARYTAQMSAVAGLGASPWELVRNSKADQRVLNTFAVDPDAKSGYFLVGPDDKITTGVLLRPGKLGSVFAPPGWKEIKQKLATTPAVVLPVTPSGMTTELPDYAFVIAIRDAKGAVRGEFVFEQALTSDAPFSQEIAQLRDPDATTSTWIFVDSAGSIVASSDNVGLGTRVQDQRYLTAKAGVTEIGKDIVVTADVPALGWRLLFRENRSQFVGALSGPLQTTGLVLVLLLLGVGLTLVVILIRRLRESREQERRLAELTRSQSEFISIVSHELRTPAAGVLGFLQTTVDHWSDMTDEDRLTTVKRAVTNARRLQTMTRDVLDTESIEAGRLGYAFHEVDLRAELRTAIEGTNGQHRVVLTGPDLPIPVEADPDRLQQVISNLLDNARRNSPPHESIEIETEFVDGPERRVRVAVIDAGPGVDEKSVERIFDRFVRADDNAVNGTGLGLYIARRIIEAHGGRIWCESTPGTRTRFVFELPVVRSRVELPQQAAREVIRR
jgi:signal transduction histidine kinase